MGMGKLERTVAEAFLEMAQGLESGQYGRRPKIALTGMGSEHGEENAMAAALTAAAHGVDVYYIGSIEAEGVKTVHVANDEEGHAKMDELLSSGEVDGAVTMHYPFPIGVSTVGRIVTPALGKEMLIANTTGTSSTDRVEGMVLNAIAGVSVAKALGKADPAVGILNVDGARQCEMVLKELVDGGYHLNFAESSRADGGCVMRGNDVLRGTPDVMVTDSLTGNVINKVVSAFTTGGSFESTGFGYGPGIGRDYDRLVLIVSRASGAPVLANAIEFAADLVRHKVFEIAKAEYEAADAAGLKDILAKRKSNAAKPESAEEAKAPEKEPCGASILGVDVMDLDDAVHVLWKAGIYAESGMGCTGPVVMMGEENEAKARELLKGAGYIG
jgi:hypothetical protein